jgi:hypothetical protein
MKVSFFKSIKSTSPQHHKDVGYLLDRIREGKSKKQIENLRFEPDLEKKKELKLLLPVVCFNGEFVKRANNFFKKPSGLMILDFDHLENPAQFKKTLIQDNRIFSCWISPSGDGVKALIRIPLVGNDEEFKSVFSQVVKVFPKVDKSGKDISRACFESYDPDIYVNINSEKFEYVPEAVEVDLKIGVQTNIPLTDQDEIANRLMVWFRKHFNNNARNSSLFKLASAFNDFGISKNTCEIYLSPFEEPDFKLTEIQSVINSAYKKTHNFGTKFFEDKQKRDKIKNMVLSGRQEKEILETVEDVPLEKIKSEISKVKSEVDISTFWDFDKNGNIKINPFRFKIYLESLNFYKFFPVDKLKPFLFITKTENFINTVSEYEIKDRLLNVLIEENKIEVFNALAKNTSFFTPQYLSMLETANISIEKDGKDYSMIYFKNKAVKVYDEYYETYDYSELDGFVWENQIIPKDFKVADHHDSMFRTFVWKISGENVEKYNTLKSVIGYLLHSYKTSANNKAIILNDETISDLPNGGSGKGIFMNAIGKMKKLATIDGKTFDFNKTFAYQTVPTDCQVLFYDDVKRNFEFERLFSQITEGITIEYKNQGAVKLPVQDSPKLAISSNYTVQTEGGSFERRVFELEFSAFFNSNNTPLDFFGCMLFDDWDDSEWSRFFMYQINCIQFYLQNGLVKSKTNNLKLRKLINETCSEFMEWVNDGGIPLGVRLGKGESFELFKKEFFDLKWATSKMYVKWIKKWSAFMGYQYEEANSNGIRWFMIEKPIEKVKENTGDIDWDNTELKF